MKTTGQCPKCGSRRIGEPLSNPQGIYLKILRIVQNEYYVCRDCGFVEQYLTDRGRETFEKHGPPLLSRGAGMCTTCGASVLPSERICDKCGSIIK